ncbi:MAG: trigger factor [Sphingobacteriaceae bacterium]|nr:trigger factor [Sphingobacteriaceae bacterium]
MMNITKKEIDSLNAEITIKVGPADYESKIKEGIKKVQRQASMPGFRPGKVPEGMIKKQYGTQIMVDEINKLLNESIHKFIEENKIEILGNPMPKQDSAIDFEKQTDFEFTYEIGLAPQFNVKLDNKTSFNYKTVKIDDELVEKYIKDVRRNYGKPINPDVAGDKDVVFIDINELDETGAIKAGGVYKSTSVGLDRLKNETGKAKLTGAKKEDKIVLNVNDLYETGLDKSVSLGIDKDAAETFNSNLQLTVKNIARLDDAALDQELFDKIYGPGIVNSEEEFRNKVKHELGLMFQVDADKFLQAEIEKTLVDSLGIDLPDAFLKRWLLAVNEKPISEEQLEKEYPIYAKSMQWKLIENKIIKDNSITVSAEEAMQEASGYIRSEYAKYGQQTSDEEVSKIALSLLSKEKEAQKIYENMYTRKVLELIKSTCSLNTKEVSYDDFLRITNDLIDRR